MHATVDSADTAGGVHSVRQLQPRLAADAKQLVRLMHGLEAPGSRASRRSPFVLAIKEAKAAAAAPP